MASGSLSSVSSSYFSSTWSSHVSPPYEFSGSTPQASLQWDAHVNSLLLPAAHPNEHAVVQPLDQTGLKLTKGFKSYLEGEGRRGRRTQRNCRKFLFFEWNQPRNQFSLLLCNSLLASHAKLERWLLCLPALHARTGPPAVPGRSYANARGPESLFKTPLTYAHMSSKMFNQR